MCIDILNWTRQENQEKTGQPKNSVRVQEHNGIQVDVQFLKLALHVNILKCQQYNKNKVDVNSEMYYVAWILAVTSNEIIAGNYRGKKW